VDLANEVRGEFLHAWNDYKKYAWGHDDLKPLSKTYHDWYAEPLLMTPVDALDTMLLMQIPNEPGTTRKPLPKSPLAKPSPSQLILMNFENEQKTVREYLATHLSFDKDISVQNFEITIRLLGGLLSAYEMTGDKRLLNLAEDLGNRLLPVFNSPTGLPYRYINLKTRAVSGNVTNPAEAGTLLIEFGTLARLTHRQVFYDKAKKAMVEIYNRRSPIGLVGTWINVETGQWTDTDSHISGAIDSYYEYLLKCAILFDDQDCRRMWNESIKAINSYLAPDVSRYANRTVKGRTGLGWVPELWYGHADMNSGKQTSTVYGALDAFFPAVLALSGDLWRARRLQSSSFRMWQLNNIEPEELDFSNMRVTSPGYPLRPEIVESTYYLYHYASLTDPFRSGRRPPPRGNAPRLNAKYEAVRYQRMGEQMWRDFVKYCRNDVGYAALKSVITKEKSDSMQSFLFAETFKYFYLLFASPRTLDFDSVIFNTEAHPIRKSWATKPPAAKN
jgi:mannosidase alpha-like ER degradation enhancer 2